MMTKQTERFLIVSEDLDESVLKHIKKTQALWRKIRSVS